MNTTVIRLASVIVFAFGIFQRANAAQINIDFEDTDLIANFGVTSLSSRGFTFVSAEDPGLGTLINGNPCSPNCAANGTKTLTISGFGAGVGSGGTRTQPVNLSNDKGLPFQLLALDIAEFTNTSIFNADRIQLTGNVIGGGTLAQVLFIDGINDGPGGVADFEAAVLDAAWSTTSLLSLKFQGFRGGTFSFFNEGFILDNIKVNVAVPESSSTLSLMVLGGLGLGSLIKRKLLNQPKRSL
ncbi:hypothetical protein [uncultured Nostoc sp.]|uniref:hypothetical protein n=1 Tax=uncultured Nostoc sp. TaxID=340711 RepID=UPI0035CA12CC